MFPMLQERFDPVENSNIAYKVPMSVNQFIYLLID